MSDSRIVIILFPTGLSVQLTDFEGGRGVGSHFCTVFYRQHLDNVLSSRVESSCLMRFVAQLQQIWPAAVAAWPY